MSSVQKSWLGTEAQTYVSPFWEMFDLTCILNKACPLPKGPWGFRLCSHPAQYHGAAFHPLNKFAPNSKFWRNVFSPSFTCRMSHRGAWRRGGRSLLGRRKTTPSGCIHGLIKSNAWCKKKKHSSRTAKKLNLWLRSSLPQDFLKGVTVKEIVLCPGQSAGGTASCMAEIR